MPELNLHQQPNTIAFFGCAEVGLQPKGEGGRNSMLLSVNTYLTPVLVDTTLRCTSLVQVHHVFVSFSDGLWTLCLIAKKSQNLELLMHHLRLGVQV